MASYTTDRPSSPTFAPFVLKPHQADLIGGDVPKTGFILDGMTSDGSSSTGNATASPGPVLPPPGAVTAATDSELLETATLSPEVVARLEQIINNFRNSTHHAANGSTSVNGTSPLRLPLGGGIGGGASGGSADDVSLTNEKRRHEETKRLLADTEARLERLIEELEDRNGDLEEFRVDVRDLKDQIEAAGIDNDSLRKRLTDLSQVEQQLSFQVETQRALEARLRMEMEGRRAVDADLVASRLAHANDIQAFEKERKLHVAAAAINAQQLDQIRELQQQLDAANKRVTARDRMLADAETEKRALQATVFDARHNIEETAAVFGEASLAFNTEVDRLMSTLLSMKLSTVPRTVLPSQASQPSLPPTPPRR
ncbi:hypothetical protein SEUCBS140593_006130 [Sporothrix eucalyptigena]|uniref:SWI5-dependent HO expression protein 3 n=1 Tax=Sporothrix eucalyptigena TaxID=1812306 RepID=A0ABP0C297_9PEZI